jgi:superoxide dismutase
VGGGDWTRRSHRCRQPLVVCDVYEHAFYVDYTNRKQEYVTKFVQFLDWDEINRRFRSLAT